MILGVLAFWLFAQTVLNIAPAMAADLGVQTSVMNIAVSITALFSGIFIVVLGGVADRAGRVKVVQWGFVFGIVGALLVGFAPAGALASAFLIAGRICQGLSAACIMPASLALVKAYWSGAERQRAVSLWSMGSWGGSGFAALFGGLVAQNLGWRWIFFAAAIVSAIGMLMVRGTPESRSRGTERYRLDTTGIVTFMVAMIALQRFGPRRPMIWGSFIVGASIVLLMPTNTMLGTYRILAVIAFTLFGVGLGFYATPSTDAALSNLPDDQAGSGSGIYKMASSLGASFGVAISAAIFTALSADRSAASWVAGALTFAGRQDNLAVREAAFVAFAANLLMVVAAVVSIMLTIPRERRIPR
jgi:MFS family permease